MSTARSVAAAAKRNRVLPGWTAQDETLSLTSNVVAPTDDCTTLATAMDKQATRRVDTHNECRPVCISDGGTDLYDTDHPRVYKERENTSTAAVNAAKKLAEAFPDYDVHVSIGPYRFYDVRYEVLEDEKVIELDFYSVRPGYNRMDEIIEEIEEAL